MLVPEGSVENRGHSFCTNKRNNGALNFTASSHFHMLKNFHFYARSGRTSVWKNVLLCFMYFSFPPGVHVGTLNFIAPIPGLSILTSHY